MNDKIQEMDKSYYYEFSIKTRGICNTHIDNEDELRTLLVEDLSAVYGDGGFDILELRPATEQEITDLNKQIEDLQKLLDTESEDATIN